MANYAKIYLRGWASIRNTSFWDIVEVSLNIDDLMTKIKSWEIKTTDLGNVRFSVMKKKPESIREGDSTHYLVHSYKLPDEQERDPLQDLDVDNDLPFGE